MFFLSFFNSFISSTKFREIFFDFKCSTNLFDLYIIDSSNSYPINFKYKNILLNSSKWIKPSGVYDAINVGINLCKTSYLMTLNSGDTANTQNLKEAIISDLYNGSQDIDIIVGAQDMLYKNIFYKVKKF